jgi:thiamine biosynthesis lipoprotein
VAERRHRDARGASPAGGLHRVEEVMGIPVGIDVRDDGIDPGALDRAFDWLRWVDATFSTYRADSEVSRLNAGTLALGDAAPEVRAVLARCETLRGAPAAASTSAPRRRSTRRPS